MSKLITGIFPTRGAADQAYRDLMNAGFRPENVSVLMPETDYGQEFNVEKHNKAAEGAGTGAAIGGAVGAVAAGLAAVATVAVPGMAFVAAGPIVAALTGLGAGAAAGGLTGALVGLGIPEHEAKLYKDKMGAGGVLVGVHADGDREKEAKRILESAGAEKI
jgi:hypothetical protein